MDGQSLRQMWSFGVKVTSPKTQNDLGVLAAMGEVIKQRQRLIASFMMQQSAGLPVLCQYSADGTPMKLKSRVAVPKVVAQGGAFARRGSLGGEYLSQRAFIKVAQPVMSKRICALVSDSIPMDKGKSSEYVFNAYRKFLPLLSNVHPFGINITASVFDRALWSSVSRLTMQYLISERAKKARHTDPNASLEEFWQQYMDWDVFIACVNHDVQNSLKWAVQHHLENPKEAMSDLFIVVEALRNSYVYLAAAMPEFIETYLDFTDEHYVDNETLKAYWTAFGAKGDMHALLVDMNLWWTGEKLAVPLRHQSLPDISERISKCLLYMLKYKKFSESRWLSIALVCRTLMVSLTVGLSSVLPRGMGQIGTSMVSPSSLLSFADLHRSVGWLALCLTVLY